MGLREVHACIKKTGYDAVTHSCPMCATATKTTSVTQNAFTKLNNNKTVNRTPRTTLIFVFCGFLNYEHVILKYFNTKTFPK